MTPTVPATGVVGHVGACPIRGERDAGRAVSEADVLDDGVRVCSTMVCVAASITPTVSGSAFATYAWEPSGLTATKRDWALTPMVAVTAPVLGG